ncbi:hypothetical protein SAMN05216327_113191 [Dyadobacter sp. SG02]|uniref:hypothetical protein n=1 Tax=Dyadobacter sp. SG02 TaxID=1855291 RepID=UPI0008C09B70|nr:hypothetical protein [Dyadobacter sp. SG02]SEJ59813.1 hypothetical protein SAMN05216327_113191 [Dyadobacter sp. SG02]
MIGRKTLLVLVATTLLLLFMELMLRLGLLFLGYPFFLPANYLPQKYYPFIEKMPDARPEKDARNILILGGSVVNTDWSRMEKRLDTLFQKSYPGIKKFNFFNVAMPGHSSLDNLIKYKLLKDRKFDLVIYYEAINENRANNISDELFHPDYSHIKWYDEINLLAAHPEMNVTVAPYVVHLVIKTVRQKLAHRQYISNDEVDPALASYGAHIKTAESYYNNVSAIAGFANERKEPILLVKYASFFPKGVKLTGEQADKKYFTPCFVVSPVTTWGKPDNVKKGIQVHNAMLEKVHKTHKSYMFDMSAVMPKDSVMFCDVCHLSEQGAQLFAKNLAGYVVSNKIIHQ